jgi:hypothetical protein
LKPSTYIGNIKLFQYSCYLYFFILTISHFVLNEGFYPRFILNTILGTLIGPLRILPDIFLSDIIKEDEIVNNKGRRDGVFLGVYFNSYYIRLMEFVYRWEVCYKVLLVHIYFQILNIIQI